MCRSKVIYFVSHIGFEFAVFKNEWKVCNPNAALGGCAAQPNLSLTLLSDRGNTEAITATVCCACQVPTTCIMCQKYFPQLAIYLL